MIDHQRSSFFAVCRAEILFNSRRLAPYVLAVAFSANAIFWWALGPAEYRGWVTNSEFFIVRLFSVFTFMTLPLFIALMMGDPVIRDFQIGIDPLLFSKPLKRLAYLLGKFVGNFGVLVACQACFALTLAVLQFFSTDGMLVSAPRIIPYIQHFFVIVVVSSLLPAAVFFAVGTLTRNVKIVYGLTVVSYVVYIAFQVSIKAWPRTWRVALDPLLFNFGDILEKSGKGNADWLNRVAVEYDTVSVANRVAVVIAAALCLAIVHVGFTIGVPTARRSRRAETAASAFGRAEVRVVEQGISRERIQFGLRTWCDQLLAAIGVELRLLGAERSMVVVAPLIVLASVIGIAYYPVAASASHSAEYATRSADALSLLLCATAVFYTIEAMFRDRATRIEPLVWSAPSYDAALVLAKCIATAVVVALVAAGSVTASVVLQIVRNQLPVSLAAYGVTYALVLVPGIATCIAASAVISGAARDKHVAHAILFSLGVALYFLYSSRHVAWWYNPTLYRVWTAGDVGGPRLEQFTFYAMFWCGVAVALAAVAVALQKQRRSRL
jgi:ABC-2 type transport system permease protein